MSVSIYCFAELFTRSMRVTTGKEIDPYVIDVVFSLFDQDGRYLTFYFISCAKTTKKQLIFHVTSGKMNQTM